MSKIRIKIGFFLVFLGFVMISLTSFIYEPEPIRCTTAGPASDVFTPILFVMFCVLLIAVGVLLAFSNREKVKS